MNTQIQNHIREVPEQAQAHDAGTVSAGQTATWQLRTISTAIQIKTGSDVQTVRYQRREERRQEAAAIRAHTVNNNQVMEFRVPSDKSGTNKKRQRQP